MEEESRLENSLEKSVEDGEKAGLGTVQKARMEGGLGADVEAG